MVYDYHSLLLFRDNTDDEFVRFNRLGDYLNRNSEDLRSNGPVPFSSERDWVQHYDRGTRNNDYDNVSFRESYLGLKDRCPPSASTTKQSDEGQKWWQGNFLDEIPYSYARELRGYEDENHERRIAALEEEYKTLKAQAETLRQETEASSSSADEQSDDNVPSTCNCHKGILGQRHLFDFALLAKDVRAWKSQGLELTNVLNCLNDSHVRLGPSLRARTLSEKDEIYHNFHEKRVNIGEQH